MMVEEMFTLIACMLFLLLMLKRCYSSLSCECVVWIAGSVLIMASTFSDLQRLYIHKILQHLSCAISTDVIADDAFFLLKHSALSAVECCLKEIPDPNVCG